MPMSKIFSVTLLVVGLLAAIAPMALSQTAMPDSLVARFGTGVKSSDFFYYQYEASGEEMIRVGLAFKNSTSSEKKIVLTYFFKAAEGVVPGESVQEVDVSYRPTAICRRAGYTDRFYVVGWAERPSNTVVEEWELTGGALGQTYPTGGGHSQSTLLLPLIDKNLLFSASNIGPICTAVCNPFANSLWLMEEAAPKKVWSVDLDDPVTRTVIFDSTSDSSGNLSQCTSLTAGRHPTAGFVIFFEKKRKWISGTLYHEPYQLRVFRDVNLDGTMEVVENRTFDDLYTAYAPGTWIIKYHE